MPSYPFSPRPYFIEFKQILCDEFGCEFKILEVNLDRTTFYTVPNFERDLGGRILTAVVNFEDNDRVEFSDIRRICRALEIPVSRFGLTLSDWFDPPDESS